MTHDFSQQPTPTGAAPLAQEAFELRPSAGGPPPLGEALRHFPQQYLRVLRKASERTFAQEMDQASWALVWMQLLGLTVLDIALTWVFNLFPSLAAFAPTTVGGRDPHWLEQLPFSAVLSHPLGQLLLTPVDFFLISGLLYLLARAFGGQGSFLRQNYTQLLVSMPLTLLYGLLALVVGVIPFVSLPLFAVVAFAFFIYGLILQAQALMAVHALSGGKALGVVALTIVAVFLISHVPGGSLLVGF